VALSDAGTGTLVVVAAPEDDVQISPRPDVAADGTISRTWERVPATGGIAITALPPAAFADDEALRYRVTRMGAVVDSAMPPGYRADVDRFSPPEVSITWLAYPVSSPDADVAAVLAETAVDTLTRIGLSPSDVPFAVLGDGNVPAPGHPPTRAYLMTALLPSGATYTEARLVREVDGRLVGGAWCGSELRRAGRPVGDQVFAVRCDLPVDDAGAEAVSRLVVVGPTSAVRARTLDADGGTLAEFDLTHGVAVVPAPDGAVAVQALAANGFTVDQQRPLMGFVDWDQE
jgi:hypothetical protein